MTALALIVCPALRASLTREACGAQVTRRYAPAVCRGCELGAAHARGEEPTHWPDGAAVKEVVPVFVPTPAPPARSHKRKVPTFETLGESVRRKLSAWRAA